MKNRHFLLILYSNKWIKFLFIPCILLLFYITSSLFFNSFIGFTSLTQNYNKDILIQRPQGMLLKKQSIIVEFNAKENDLGIIFLQFLPRQQVQNEDQDILFFQIKEKDSKKWWYQNLYKSNAIAGLPLFPFGFPKFTDSKGKTFIVTITSLSGNKENALQLSSVNPILISKYVFSKGELQSNKKQFIQFLIKKCIYSFMDINFLEASLIYLLPLVFYSMWIFVFERAKKEMSLLLIMPILILIATYLKIELLSGVFYAVILFWIITIGVYKVESSVSFLFAGFFFFLAFCGILFGEQELGGRLSNWTYVFLATGAVQLVWELKNPNENRLTYRNLLQSIAHIFKISKKVYHR